MAKGNIILGQMRGSIGDIVFWRGNGEQLSRSRNRRPANPRTDSQLTTRIILKTCSTAYSKLMFDYANQTFQGAKIGAENQRKFMSANTKILRDYIKQGADDMNFNGKDDTVAMLNRYRVSEGNLPTIGATVANPVSGSSTISLGQEFTIAGSVPTYQEICDAFGLAPGTQLTFLLCNIRQGVIQYVQRKRIILSPASGDMSVAFIADGAINDPNPANDALGLIPDYSGNKLNFEAFGDFLAVAVAASFYDGTKWQYSTEQIWYSPTAGLGVHTLSQAIASWQVAIAGSEEYTRQANAPESGSGQQIARRVVRVICYNGENEELGRFTFTDDECDEVNVENYVADTYYATCQVVVSGSKLAELDTLDLDEATTVETGGTSVERTILINSAGYEWPIGLAKDFEVVCGEEVVSHIILAPVAT